MALGEDDRWLRSVVENSSEIVKIVDPDGTLRYASTAFEMVLGYAPEEVAGKMNVLDNVHPEDLPHVLEETEKALSEGGVTTNEAEYRFRHADGSWRWVESVSTYLLDDPHVKGVVVQTRDVTGRKEAEERLAESERRFSSVVTNAQAYAYRCLNEPGYPNVYASDYALELTGYPPDELLVEGEIRFSDLIVEEDRNRVRAEIQNALAERRSFEIRYALRRRDGQIRHVLEHGQGVHGEDGEVEAIEGLVYEVTEAVRVEERLRETEAGYRTLVERVPPTIYIQRPREGQTAAYDTTFMSPRVEELLGYPPRRFLEDPEFWDNVIHPDDRERVLAEDERTDRTGEPFSMKYRVVDEKGHTVWVRDEATLVRDAVGESLYWFGTLIDITERMRTEDALREARDRFRSIFDHAPIGVAMVSLEGRYMQVNGSLCEILGYTEEELQALTWQEITHPDDLATSSAYARRIVEGEFSRYHLEKRFLHADGHTVWASLSVSLVRDSEGEPLYFVSQIQDVTERRRVEVALKESEQRFRRSFEDATIGMALVGTDGRWLQVNRSLCEILGYQEVELLSKTFQDITHPDDLDVDLDNLRRMLAGETRTYQTEKRYFHREGHVVWILLSVSLVQDEEGDPLYFISQIQDITERKALEERLHYQAFHDPLTDLPNRQLFMDRLGQALRRSRRWHKRVAVLFMDLDGFKVVNDSLGHEVGDFLLTVVAQRLRRCLRPEDTLARFGGDEFTVLIEALDDPAQAVQVAERITEELRRPVNTEGRDLYVIASIGISLGGARTHDPDALLREADTAMYRAKDEGGDFRVFNPAMYKRVFRRLEVENDLRRAIEQEEFVLHYQSMVDLHTGELWGMEALVRWDHPERGLLEPSEFVPVAEESGLVIPMGEQILREACFRAKEWQEENPRIPPLVMSVNLSASQLSRLDLADTVERILGETGLEGSCLILDVTETVYVKVLAGNTAILDRLRGLGVRFSIDDFGTGYSSLSYLKRLPADVIKIDQSFVKNLGEDVEDMAVVRMIIELAHTLDLEVIAEGVETEEQAALLKEMGCDLAQGYHFSRPLPPEAASG